MGQVMILRRSGLPTDGIPKYSYSGSSEIIDEGNKNWQIRFLSSGNLTIQGYRDVPVDAFLVGGGGAGNRQGGAGGGGYSATRKGFVLRRDVTYPITVGAGGTTSGAAGGKTTALSTTGNGGGGGIAGVVTGRVCTVQGTTGLAGNVYFYSSLSASAVSIGSNYQTVSLAYPITGANHTNGTYLHKAAGAGYYRCNIVAQEDYIATTGSNGTGGAATYAFDGTSGTRYGGTGSKPSTADGGANTGKGGGGSDSYSGTAFGDGGSGIVIFRNAR